MKDRFPVTKLLPMLADDVAERVRELVPNIDEAEVIRKSGVRATSEVLDDEYAIIQYVSTRDLDRDKEILDPDGAMLNEFKAAPQVLWGHDYSAPPIGKDEWIKSDGYGLKAKTIYAVDEYADANMPNFAKLCYNLRKGEYLNTSSVGFVPIEWTVNGGSGWAEVVNRLKEKWQVTAAHFNDTRCIYTKWLLLEHSDVSVPANPNARTVAKSYGASEAELRRLGMEIEEDAPAEPEAAIVEVRQVVERWCRPVVPVEVRPVKLPLDVRAATEQSVRELVGVR